MLPFFCRSAFNLCTHMHAFAHRYRTSRVETNRMSTTLQADQQAIVAFLNIEVSNEKKNEREREKREIQENSTEKRLKGRERKEKKKKHNN